MYLTCIIRSPGKMRPSQGLCGKRECTNSLKKKGRSSFSSGSRKEGGRYSRDWRMKRCVPPTFSPPPPPRPPPHSPIMLALATSEAQSEAPRIWERDMKSSHRHQALVLVSEDLIAQTVDKKEGKSPDR